MSNALSFRTRYNGVNHVVPRYYVDEGTPVSFVVPDMGYSTIALSRSSAQVASVSIYHEREVSLLVSSAPSPEINLPSTSKISIPEPSTTTPETPPAPST